MIYKRILFMTEDYDPHEIHVYQLDVLEDMDNDAVVDAIGAAAGEFLHTEDGKNYLEGENGCFNYGDALTQIPDHITVKHGYLVVDEPHDSEIVVDHNTHLVPADLEE